MPLRLRGWRCFELRWWWESPPPAGKRVRLRDADAARNVLASLHAWPENRAPLRRFFLQGAPGRWSSPDDAELTSLLAAALSTGRATITELPAEQLITGGAPEEEEARVSVSAPVSMSAPLPPAEEVCWPCLKAAASARALREASVEGAPFVAQD